MFCFEPLRHLSCKAQEVVVALAYTLMVVSYYVIERIMLRRSERKGQKY